MLDELHGFMSCGILGRGFAHLYCEGCGQHHVVAFSRNGKVIVVADETMGDKYPLLAPLLAAATAGAPPAGWANKRRPVRIVLDPHAASRSEVVPAPATPPAASGEQDKPKRRSMYIRWAELLRRVFGIEVVCEKCKAPLRLIALIKSEATATRILTAMHLPTEVP